MSAYNYQSDFFSAKIPTRGICPTCLSRVCEHFPAIPRRKLSPRRLEVIRLVANGLKNKEVAKILKIKEDTVKIYLTQVYALLGLTGRFELIQWVNRHPEVFGA